MTDSASSSYPAGDPAATFREVIRGIVEEPLELVSKQVTDTVHSSLGDVGKENRRLRQGIEELRKGRGEHAYTLPELANEMRAIEQRLSAQGETTQQAVAAAAAERQSATTTLINELDAHATRQQAGCADLRSAMNASTQLMSSAVESLSADVARLRQDVAAHRRLLAVAIGLMVLLAAAGIAISLIIR